MDNMFLLRNVLTPDQIKATLGLLDDNIYQDGKSTANGTAKDVKHNEQVDLERLPELADEIITTLRDNREFQYLSMPQRLSSLLISRYIPGMAYGTHTDSAVMNGGGRSDLSFTLMLSDQNSYEGGELCMETPFGEKQFKIPAGALVLYPTGGLHRVNQVVKGSRIAIVGWVQSRIRDDRKRQILQDLDLVRKAYLDKIGHDRTADLLLRSTANLQRMWDEG